MSQHYYTQEPTAAHDIRDIAFTARGRHFALVTDAGTFSREGLDRGSAILLEALPELSGAVLDLGCGWGAMGLVMAATMPETRVTLSDVNLRSLETARRNAQTLGLDVTAVHSDGFAALSGPFDAIICNPPIRAGKAVTYALYLGCREHLAAGGTAYFVIRKQQGAESATTFLKTLFSSVERIAREAGYWVIACS